MTPSPSTNAKNELTIDLPPMPTLTPTLVNALLVAIRNSAPNEEPSADAVAGSCQPAVIAS